MADRLVLPSRGMADGGRGRAYLEGVAVTDLPRNAVVSTLQRSCLFCGLRRDETKSLAHRGSTSVVMTQFCDIDCIGFEFVGFDNDAVTFILRTSGPIVLLRHVFREHRI